MDERLVGSVNELVKLVYMNRNLQVHPFHLVDPSPWPILASGSVSTLLGGSVLYFHGQYL